MSFLRYTEACDVFTKHHKEPDTFSLTNQFLENLLFLVYLKLIVLHCICNITKVHGPDMTKLSKRAPYYSMVEQYQHPSFGLYFTNIRSPTICSHLRARGTCSKSQRLTAGDVKFKYSPKCKCL